MSALQLRCRCGGMFQMDLGEFINPGGRPDDRHRVFIADLRADEWLDRHAVCLLPPPRPVVPAPPPARY